MNAFSRKISAQLVGILLLPEGRRLYHHSRNDPDLTGLIIGNDLFEILLHDRKIVSVFTNPKAGIKRTDSAHGVDASVPCVNGNEDQLIAVCHKTAVIRFVDLITHVSAGTNRFIVDFQHGQSVFCNDFTRRHMCPPICYVLMKQTFTSAVFV